MKRILSTYALIFLVVLILAWVGTAHCQTVAPFQGLGNVQFFDNSGAPLTAGVLYSFVAGTSTQQATYTDATGLILNPNPIPFGTGARVGIWLTSGALYKFVLCLKNDGAFCAPSDVLFSVDQVPATSSSGGGGGGGGSPFIGTFISGSSTPATSGILRLASGDTVCFRNTANSANLCWRKDSNDLLSWDGGSFKLPEVGAPACSSGFDVLWADNTAHAFKGCMNGAPALQFVYAGQDINTGSQVTQLHFGGTGTPLSATPPTTGQFLQWNGTNIIGYSQQNLLTWCPGSGNNGACVPQAVFNEITGLNWGNEIVFVSGHTITRFTYNLNPGSGCSTLPIIGVRDMTSSTNLSTSTIANGATGGFVDSGALSTAITGGDKIMVGVITAAVGCGVNPTVANVTMSYQ